MSLPFCDLSPPGLTAVPLDCAGSGSGMGFCRGYSFNTGDLTTCGDVLLNYLEAYESVPWDDLRYMFGEVGAVRRVGITLPLMPDASMTWLLNRLHQSQWCCCYLGRRLTCPVALALQIFYGGHITDGMDRRCCMTYLQVGQWDG